MPELFGRVMIPQAVFEKPILTPQMRAFVRAELERQNDLTLPELCERVEKQLSIGVSASTMRRALREMSFGRKKRLSIQPNETRKE